MPTPPKSPNIRIIFHTGLHVQRGFQWAYNSGWEMCCGCHKCSGTQTVNSDVIWCCFAYIWGLCHYTLCLWKTEGLLQHFTPRLGAAVYPMFALLSLSQINKNPFINSLKKTSLNTSLEALSSLPFKLKHTWSSFLHLQPLDHSGVCARATQMKGASTSTNRLSGGSQSQCANTVQKERNLKTEPSPRATPALCTNSKLKKQDERIRLGEGGGKDKLARGSQDESK